MSTLNIEWVKAGVWIGIAEASEASKCELKEDYYECEKDSVNMIAGGPSSDGKITWNLSQENIALLQGETTHKLYSNSMLIGVIKQV